MLPNLPSTTDEFWTADEYTADTQTVDMVKRKPHLCRRGEHVMTIDFAGREATCDICGWGFRFTPDKVEYKDGALYDKSGNLLG